MILTIAAEAAPDVYMVIIINQIKPFNPVFLPSITLQGKIQEQQTIFII